eukprot:1383268-Alexandrium_andersonii.AAC.1
MSASLVGSEMCIRDRHAGRLGFADWSARLPARDRCAQVRIRRAASAVSYTHLTLPTICSV